MERLDYPVVLRHVAAGDRRALFDLLAGRLKTLVGFELFTVLAPDPSGRHLRRLYSTDEATYPLGPADIVDKTPWFEQLFGKGQPVVATDSDEIAAWLPDFGGLAGTELGSLVNCPVVVADRTIGIINLMDRPGRYNTGTAALLVSETQLSAMAITAHLWAAAPTN